MPTRDQTLAALRLLGPLVLLCSAPRLELQVVASALLFAGAFAAAHDMCHGALGLSPRTNGLALSVSAQGMLLGGHAMRLMHLRHHARPLAADDIEGAGANRSWWAALACGPVDAVLLRVEAFRAANARGRVRQVAEMVVSLGLVIAAAYVQPLRVHVVVACTLQGTMSFWAAHVPHHTPRWLSALSERLAFLGSPVLLSLAFHERHHRHPRVPCRSLARAPAS